MKHTYRTTIAGVVEVKQKHEHYGLLPTFDLDTTANIVAWNKLRIFLQTYEQRSSRRLQVSVLYLLSAWVATCIYQAVKAYLRRGAEVIDIETIFVFSTTSMLAVGLSAILFTGKKINDITQIGFAHVLRVKQAEMLDKSTHYLVEHDFFNGSFAHDGSEEGATSRKKCVLHDHHYGELGGLQVQSIQGLSTLKVSQLRERCKVMGVCDEDVHQAVDDPRSPKKALIELLNRRQEVAARDQLERRRTLKQMPRTDLEECARQLGVSNTALVAAGDIEDPTGNDDPRAAHNAIVELILDAEGNQAQRQHPIYDSSDLRLLDAINIKARGDGSHASAADLDGLTATPEEAGRRSWYRVPSASIDNAGALLPDPAQVWAETRLHEASQKRSAAMMAQCYKLLEALAQTVRDEYRVGARGHWGAEDRRTKLGFIVLGQNTIKGFAAALLSGISPIIIHAIDKSGMFDP